MMFSYTSGCLIFGAREKSACCKYDDEEKWENRGMRIISDNIDEEKCACGRYDNKQKFAGPSAQGVLDLEP